MSELPFTKKAEEKLNEIGFVTPRGVPDIIRLLAEQTARRHGDKTVTVYGVKNAYRYWFYRMKGKEANVC